MRHVTVCPICNSSEFEPYITTTDYTVTKQTFHVKKCLQCGLLITTPRPETTDLGRYYESKDYVSHSRKANSWFHRIYGAVRTYTLESKRKLLKSLTSEPTILDYGCGTGHLLAHLHKNGWKITGVEPSDTARSIAHEQLGTHNIYQSLPEVPGRYPLITLWHVLEHIPELDTILQSLQSKLTTNGIILVAVPNINSWESNHYQNFWAAYDTPRHLWHFSRETMQKLAAKNGMIIREVFPMKFDSYYVSMLSEKYRNNGTLGLAQFFEGMLNGFKSNNNAAKTGEYSSLIYILKNANA